MWVVAWLQHYKPPDEGPSEYQTIPLSKIEDFGVHCKSYYSLDIAYFKSSLDAGLLDLLWAKYWVSFGFVRTMSPAAGQVLGVLALGEPKSVLVHMHPYYEVGLFMVVYASTAFGNLQDLLSTSQVATLASSPLLSTRDLTAGQIRDIGESPLPPLSLLPFICRV